MSEEMQTNINPEEEIQEQTAEIDGSAAAAEKEKAEFEEAKAIDKKFKKKKITSILLMILGIAILIVAVVVSFKMWDQNYGYVVQQQTGYATMSGTAAYKMRQFAKMALFAIGGIVTLIGIIMNLTNKAWYKIKTRHRK